MRHKICPCDGGTFQWLDWTCGSPTEDVPLSASIKVPHEFALDASVGVGTITNKRISRTH